MQLVELMEPCTLRNDGLWSAASFCCVAAVHGSIKSSESMYPVLLRVCSERWTLVCCIVLLSPLFQTLFRITYDGSKAAIGLRSSLIKIAYDGITCRCSGLCTRMRDFVPLEAGQSMPEGTIDGKLACHPNEVPCAVQRSATNIKTLVRK